MRNRYYDTARLYAPANVQPFQPKERPDAISRNAEPTHSLIPGQSAAQVTEKNKDSSDGAVHEANQEQVYVIDDSSNNITDDDDDSQIKYLYSLYKNRRASNF